MPLISTLPTLNACLNGASAFFLLTGYVLIRQRKIAAHTLCMGIAFLTSILFLISYLFYHSQVGSVRFTGMGWSRPIYFFILTTHSILAVAIVPLALRTLYLASKKAFEQHTRIARITLPLWLYVSVTGVVVYWMLYH
ncbi:MAG: DUF420 domain-containing protein [Elusimicrobia bacterium]|nr:DUF420 domain-containing protein [Elusimicrobiota bacterium]